MGFVLPSIADPRNGDEAFPEIDWDDIEPAG